MSETPIPPEPASNFQCEVSSSSTPKPSSKRRRLTVTTPSSLKRPFKSPLRPLQDNASPPLTPTVSSTTPSLASRYVPSSQPATPPYNYPPHVHTPLHSKRSTFKVTLASGTQDPELKQLKERRRELEMKIVTLRENIRSLKTFKAWRETGEEQKVDELIAKWKRVVQDAATFLLPYLQESTSVTNSSSINQWQNWGWDDTNVSASEMTSHDSDLENKGSPQRKGFNLTMEVMLKGVGIDPVVVGWNEEADVFE